MVRMALSVAHEEQDAFDAVDGAAAGTSYRRNRGELNVAKQVVVGDNVHTFTLSCANGLIR